MRVVPRYKAPRPVKKSHGTALLRMMNVLKEIDGDQAIIDDEHDKYACTLGANRNCYRSKVWHQAARNVGIPVHVYHSEDRKVLVIVLAEEERTKTPVEWRKYPGGQRPVVARKHC